jgi:CMP-N-acetylneuraminic acid synthetase
MRLAIIPARGGSKGIPNKNLLTIAGRPLLGHAIQCARWAGCDVVVSTDSMSIAKEATIYGADVSQRPDYLAGDDVSSQDVLRHVLHAYRADEVAFIQCTTPMLAPEDVRGCFDKLPDYDCVTCCVPFDGVLLNGQGKLLNMRVGGSQRRQDRTAQYLITGGCWTFRPDYLNWDWMTGRIGIHLAKYPYRIEIDAPEDVELAEAVLNDLLHRHRQHDLPDRGHGLRPSAAVA